MHWPSARCVLALLLLMASGCVDDDRSLVDLDAGATDAGFFRDGEALDAAPSLDAGMLPSDGSTPGIAADGNFLLLDLGHIAPVVHARLSGDRALTQDVTGRWNLWEISTRSIVAWGHTGPAADAGEVPLPQLRGQTLALPIDGGTELRAAQDGRVTAQLAAPVVSLSEDGSYLWRRTQNHVDLWASGFGGLLGGIDVEPQAHVFGGKPDIRVATQAPADGTGARIQRFVTYWSVPSVVSPYEGNFVAWSADGDHFLVDGPSLDEGGQAFVGVRNLNGSLLGKVRKEPDAVLFGGYGDLVIFTGPYPGDTEGRRQVTLRRAGTDQVFSHPGTPTSFVAGLLIVDSAWQPGEPWSIDLEQLNLHVDTDRPSLDRDRSTGSFVTIELDNEVTRAAVYAPNSGKGQVLARTAGLSGSASGRLAVAADGDPPRVYDLTTVPRRVLPPLPSGGTLVANGELLFDGRALFNVSTGATVHVWNTDAQLQISQDGARMLLTRCVGNGKFTPRVCTYELAAADASAFFAAPLPTDDGNSAKLLAPNGRHTAVYDRNLRVVIYRDGQVVGMHDGVLLAWVDNEHLLLGDYRPQTPGSSGLVYQGDVEIDVAGNLTRTLGKIARSERRDARSATRIDDDFVLLSDWLEHADRATERETSIWSRKAARVVWSTALPASLARVAPVVAGAYVAYQRDTQVLVERWR